MRLAAATVSMVSSALVVSTFTTSPVQARHYRQAAHAHHRYYGRAAYRQSFRAAAHAMRHHHLPVETNSGIAAMVVDANTGRTLYATHEDELRHPASVTKVMTLYLLFEQMHRGRFAPASSIPISAHAAAQPPTKIGLRPGTTITIDNAVRAIVTESANDIAVAVAEAIGGSEDAFATMMTRKAHALGMAKTRYVNASGLPDDRQITTAQDLTILGRAIQERFPAEYGYFSTRNFVYGGRLHHNHNHLLGQVEGMDGIKTGYTRASGFNLLASVRRGGRHIVSVVLGGKSYAARDRIMTSLIEDHIAEASNDGRNLAMVAESETSEPVVAAAVPVDAPTVPPVEAAAPMVAAAEALAAAQPVPATVLSPIAETAAPAMAETASLAVRPQPAFVSGAPRIIGDVTASIPTHARHIVLDGSTGDTASGVPLAYAPENREGTVRWAAGPVHHGRAQERRSPRMEARAASPKLTARAERTTPPAEELAAPEKSTEVVRDASTRTPRVRGSWVIQIGATDDLGKAHDLLARARSQVFAAARPSAERVRKGEQTLYRARFVGLEPSQAESACRALKRQGIPCFAVRD